MPGTEKRERIHDVTTQDFLNLINKRDRELLQTLNKTSFGFERLLKNQGYFARNKEINFELFEVLIEVSSRVCTLHRGGSMGSIEKFLRMLSGCAKFLYEDTLNIIGECLDHRQCIDLASFVKNYLVVLRMIIKNRLNNSKRIVDYVYPALQNILNTMKARKIRNLEDTEKEYLFLKKEVEKFDVHLPADDQDDDEIGLFRQLSIVPQQNDVINVEIEDLPCNKIDGPYSSINHYLSVHFRLMREDMLRSFRDFIKEFDNANETSKSGSRMYEYVTVAFPPKYKPEGIVHKIDIKTDRDINWAKKDVLLPGSMVCLTPDRFESVIFAVIIKEIRSLHGTSKESHTEILLEDTCEEVFEPEIKYRMVETSAYFECYRHVLAAIKDFDPRRFPFSDFLAFLDFDEPEPEYLVSLESEYKDIKTYTLHEKCDASQGEKSVASLCNDHEITGDDSYNQSKSCNNPDELAMHETVKVSQQIAENLDVKFSKGVNDPQSQDKNEECSCKKFHPLKLSEWPTAKELELDDQQLLAFQTALTKKVAVIQGPPGTGKTHIGVKIVKALLENTSLTPIIISCVTNHALDQFLEKILVFTKSVIRLGSQSKSEKLVPHTFENLYLTLKKYQEDKNDKEFQREGISKNSLRLLRLFAQDLLDLNPVRESDEAWVNMMNVCKKLNGFYSNFYLCKEKFLEDSALNDIVNSNYKDQLRQGSSAYSKSLSSSVMEWLACSRSTDLYEKCNRYFETFKNLEITATEQNIHIWKVDLKTRFKLLYIWREIAMDILLKSIDEAKDIYQKFKLEYTGRILDSMRAELLMKSHVIGVTTTGAAKYRRFLESTGAEILVIEEAAEVLESHVIASLLPTTKHLILIGDHKQLRPLPANHELSEVYNLKISMFERLFMNNAPSATLVSQHRMKPCIADLLVQEELYTDLKSFENVHKYEEIKGVKHSVFFLNHSESETERSTGTSSSNEFEAGMIVCLAKYFCLQGYTPDQITILATYAAQVPLIKNHLDEENLEVYLTTVDNYQGEENDIVLVSFVRSNKNRVIGFLSESNRVCVALSRAKKGMFCLGNFSLYSERNQLWNNIVGKLESQDLIGPKIPLTCGKHDSETLVETSYEIMEFIRQGCKQPCRFQLQCGHVCSRKCHFDDPDHYRYRCMEPCEKYNSEGKKCKRSCFERCKRTKKLAVDLSCGHRARYRKDGSIITICDEEIQRLLPCTHLDTILCSTDTSTHECKKLVSVKLPCGHRKDVFCYRSNNLNRLTCNNLTPRMGPCGHTIDVPCYLKLVGHDILPYCKNSCGKLLNCGHNCTGYCCNCYDFGIHALCRERCTEKLMCGHRCKGYCGSPCETCEEKCLLLCSHKKECINRCDRPCTLCDLSCDRQCEHTKCTNICDKECSVEPCVEKCNKTLGCSHPCIGLCGDPCPYLCRVCNDSDIKTGNIEDDCYVQLDDCDHLIEVSQLQEHIDECLECFMWPDCPVCHHPIRRSLRFKSHLLKAKQAVLNTVKEEEVFKEMDDVMYLVHSTFNEREAVPAEFQNVHKQIEKVLRQRPSFSALLVLKHCIISLQSLMLISEKLKEESKKMDISNQNRFETLLLWITNHLKLASYQQLHELETAIDKLKDQLSCL